jgi:peptide-methionine (S)-S-oxide reductase
MSEAMSELKGVNKVISGYAGGTTKNPTYEQVASLTTGHAECSQIYYDPKVISFTTLANAFFFAHDPTELNRQGPDVGTGLSFDCLLPHCGREKHFIGFDKKD